MDEMPELIPAGYASLHELFADWCREDGGDDSPEAWKAFQGGLAKFFERSNVFRVPQSQDGCEQCPLKHREMNCHAKFVLDERCPLKWQPVVVLRGSWEGQE